MAFAEDDPKIPPISQCMFCKPHPGQKEARGSKGNGSSGRGEKYKIPRNAYSK
jgi:hypothetical protein